MTDNDNLDGPWPTSWLGLVHCADCNALHHVSHCPVCRRALTFDRQLLKADGVESQFLSSMPGALPWSVHALLRQMRAEWERPLSPSRGGHALPSTAERLVIVILFWTLFEYLIDRFYESAFADLPGDLSEELLQRFPNIGGRLDRLYRRRWGTTFWADLGELGYAAEAEHLKAVHHARNAFIHGDPDAITEELIAAAIKNLHRTLIGWTAVFNRRCAGMTNKVPLYRRDMDRSSKAHGP